MLRTNLKHIKSLDELNEVINSNENVMICCGKMGSVCLTVYNAMENLREKYENVKFYDIDFDARYSTVLRNHELADEFISLPYTFYFKNGIAVWATESIQNMEEIKTILEEHLV